MSSESITVNEKEGNCIIKVNPKLYALDVIYAAAYMFIDKAYIILEGDPEKEVEIFLKPKKDGELKKLGHEFFNELLNYASYKEQSKKNHKVREAIIQRALVTNDPSVVDQEALFDKEIEQDLSDPEGILVPWEENQEKDA